MLSTIQVRRLGLSLLRGMHLKTDPPGLLDAHRLLTDTGWPISAQEADSTVLKWTFTNAGLCKHDVPGTPASGFAGARHPRTTAWCR